jgi:hypothetical protein
MLRVIFLIIFVFVISCNNNKDKPDVSDIKVDVIIERFEKKLFEIDTINIDNGLAQLNKEFPDFYNVFMNNILQMSAFKSLPSDSSNQLADEKIKKAFTEFLISYKSIHDSLAPKYKDLNWLQDDLATGFRFVKYYYPAYKIPHVITFIATFDAPGTVLTDKYLGIGLQQYAGKNFTPYQSQLIQQLYPTYISRIIDRTKIYKISGIMRNIM